MMFGVSCSIVVRGVVCVIFGADGTEEEEKYLLVIMPAELFLCVRCRRHTATREQHLCERCQEVIADLDPPIS